MNDMWIRRDSEFKSLRMYEKSLEIVKTMEDRKLFRDERRRDREDGKLSRGRILTTRKVAELLGNERV